MIAYNPKRITIKGGGDFPKSAGTPINKGETRDSLKILVLPLLGQNGAILGKNAANVSPPPK
jgi:hypothetical protein